MERAVDALEITEPLQHVCLPAITVLLLHPGIGHDGLVIFLDPGGPGIMGLAALFPVAAFHGLDIFLSGIEEIQMKAFFLRFLPDLLQNFHLLLGAVGGMGLVILFP